MNNQHEITGSTATVLFRKQGGNESCGTAIKSKKLGEELA